MGVTEELVDFCIDLAYEDLPSKVIDKVKYHTLDFVGVAARGSLVDSSQIVYDLIKDIGQSPKESVVIGTDMRAPWQYAALANGTAAHSIEMDDVRYGHASVVVFPAAFAASERAGCDWRRFAEGVVLGYEVFDRLMGAQNLVGLYTRGLYPTGICGPFAAAVVASKILDLSREEMMSALGIVGNQASGVMEFLVHGSWTHRMITGWAGHNGLIAALLAKRGFRGPPTILEGKYGFFRAYCDGSGIGKVLANLGGSYEIMQSEIKVHGSCRAEHGAIDCVLKLVGEHNLRPEEIDEVVCGIAKTGWQLVAEPIESKRSPRTVMDAQTSMPFGTAVAILYGSATVDEHTQENIDSPKVKELMNRVSCVEITDLEGGNIFKSAAEIVTKDGKRFSAKADYPKGSPENPVPWDELIAKYNRLTPSVYSEGRRAEILARVGKLEDEKKIADFCSLLLRDS